MSKRPLKPLSLGGGSSKLPKLDVTISEHNFPLSQNVQQRSAPHDAGAADDWGDVDDALLLQASQACEQVDQHNQSNLPDYSAWMHAPSTSTQLQTPLSSITNPFSYGQNASTSKSTDFSNIPSTLKDRYNIPDTTNFPNVSENTSRKETFQFKKPIAGVASAGLVREKCDRIAAPLSGISDGAAENRTEEHFVLDIRKEDSEHFYRRLMQMQEENAKLKSENGKLLEQALSKDGEVTILRGRLKSSQAAADGARLERLRAGEKLQAEWAERLSAVDKQLGSLRTQLDCKELEVVRVKERCRLLESNKVKLTQAMPPPSQHSRTLSQRHNSSFSIQHEMNGIGAFAAPSKRAYLAPAAQKTSAAVQTSPRHFLALNTAHRTARNDLSAVLPLLLEPGAPELTLLGDQPGDGLGGAPGGSQAGGGEGGRLAAAGGEGGEEGGQLAGVHEELSRLATVRDWHGLDEAQLEKCLRVVGRVRALLDGALARLERAARRLTTAARRELDDEYARATLRCELVEQERLLGGGAIFDGERALSARRAVAALARLTCACAHVRRRLAAPEGDGGFVGLMARVAGLAGSTSCAVPYSGLLLSFLALTRSLLPTADDRLHGRLTTLVRCIVSARPSPSVVCEALGVAAELSVRAAGLEGFCTDSASGNLKFDYDQGLVLYKKESCFLQVFLGQLEACVRCAERRGPAAAAVSVARGLMSVYRNGSSLGAPWCQFHLESRCKCPRRLAQVMVYALQVCARMLRSGILDSPEGSSPREELLAACRCGVAVLYAWARDAEPRSLLAQYEGRGRVFADMCVEMRAQVVFDEIQGNILTELVASLQPSEEVETPEAPLRDVWLDSFSRFQLTD